jgi:hypothetical protein
MIGIEKNLHLPTTLSTFVATSCKRTRKAPPNSALMAFFLNFESKRLFLHQSKVNNNDFIPTKYKVWLSANIFINCKKTSNFIKKKGRNLKISPDFWEGTVQYSKNRMYSIQNPQSLSQSLFIVRQCALIVNKWKQKQM